MGQELLKLLYFSDFLENLRKIAKKNRSTKSLLNPHFKGFGAITRSDSCRSCFSVHFRLGIIAKCWIDDHFVKILLFFAVFFGKKKWAFWTFFGWRLAAGAFFWAQIAFLQEKDNFPRLAACRRRFFLPKMTVSVEK